MEARVRGEAMRALSGTDEESKGLRRLTYDLVDAASGDAGVCGGTAEIVIEPKFPKPTLLVVGFCGAVVATPLFLMALI